MKVLLAEATTASHILNIQCEVEVHLSLCETLRPDKSPAVLFDCIDGH